MSDEKNQSIFDIPLAELRRRAGRLVGEGDLFYEGAGGAFYKNADGGDLLDARIGGAAPLGPHPAEIIEVLGGVLGRVDIGNHHLISEPRALLGKKLASLSPGDLNRVVYNVYGGEAVDTAIKLARGFTGSEKIICLEKASHGFSGFALAASDPHYSEGVGGQPGGFVRIPADDLSALAEAIDEDVAAFIVEPVGLQAGLRIYRPGYLKGAAAICRESGVLLIVDESNTGFGYSGKVFASQFHDVIPDILIAGRALSAGVYPLTAVLYRDYLDRFWRSRPFSHVSTFGGAEPACHTAIAFCQKFTDPAFMAEISEAVHWLAETIGKSAAVGKKNFVAGRSFGLFAALEFTDAGIAKTALDKFSEDGILCSVADLAPETVVLSLPLNIGPNMGRIAAGMIRAVEAAQ